MSTKEPFTMVEDKFHYKIQNIKMLQKLRSKNIINKLTINASFYPKIIDPVIFGVCPRVKYGPFFVCDQSVILFSTRGESIFCKPIHSGEKDLFSTTITENNIDIISINENKLENIAGSRVSNYAINLL